MIEKPKKKPKRHKMTVACDISPKVRAEVYERDSYDGQPCCIICGSSYQLEVAHYISRAHGGKGIPENLVTICRNHHKILDQYMDENGVHDGVETYLKRHYPGWDRAKLVYQKYKELDPAYRFDGFVK